jgi:hypothetical protein
MKIGTITTKRAIEAEESFYDANKNVKVLLDVGTYDVYFSGACGATFGFIRGKGRVILCLNVDSIKKDDIRTGDAYFNINDLRKSKTFHEC